MTYSVEAMVALLELAPHPEGGYFRETFRATEQVDRVGGPVRRAAGTAIYFLLPAGAFSAWHRVQSDEAWHHYDGAAVELHLIDPAGTHRVVVLGRDFARGERPQHVVPAHWLQAARPVGAAPYALCGCTVSPGFDFADFAMPGRVELHRTYPHLAAIIDDLTRD